ncbi:7889_t:CDS:2 [Acaulospora morrowiae]|uniref:7889_t:CDS:1 n=1 Tax=Acaulospora morrowiae TaxID=94023 RepID=A0A9N8ZM11_9GLOM|nr:7889_t:CDS:2 [Acaulospora morrowiae]
MGKGIVLLLRERQTSLDNTEDNEFQSTDIYETKFSSLSYSCAFLPVLSHSLLNIEELTEILRRGPENRYCGVIITSQRAVEGLMLAWKKAFDHNADGNLPIFIVGKSTSKILKELNFNTLGPESAKSGTSELLAEYIIQFIGQNKILNIQPETSLLFLVGDKRRDELPSRLSSVGIKLEELLIYRTEKREGFYAELDRTAKEYERIDWTVFFSPSGVDVALDDLKKTEFWDETKVAAIGKTTGNYLEAVKGTRVHIVSPKPDPESLVNSINEYEATASRSIVDE